MCNPMLVSGVQHSDLPFKYIMITTISLVTIYPHTKLLQHYWPYHLCCILHQCIYFIVESLCLLIPVSYFIQLCTSFPLLAPICFLYLSLFSFSFVCSFVLLFRFTCEITWYLSFSDISLSIIPFRSIHVVSNGKISFSSNVWVIFHCVYVCRSLFSHLSIDGHLAFFHALAVVKIASMNVGVHVCFEVVFHFWGINTQK